MATVTTTPMTAGDFFRWVHQPENRGKFFELERGEIVEMPPPSKYHGIVCGNAGRLLGNYAAQSGKSYPCTNDSGVVVENDPDTVRGPDIAFYEDDQTADDMDRKHASLPPKLAVEILSPNDQPTRINRRAGQLLRRGVALVWLVDPEVRCVTVCRADRFPVVLDETEELTGDDVLPEFRCRVAAFFARPGKP